MSVSPSGAGRYAPSPSGDLHFGNLRTAVLAWLFARRSGRRFLLRVEDIDESAVGAHVALADLPPPDLFIRTGGDLRISNFLLWQLAYTELWFTETLWPELGVEELERALAVYASRERRFGLTSAQIAAGDGPPLETTA